MKPRGLALALRARQIQARQAGAHLAAAEFRAGQARARAAAVEQGRRADHAAWHDAARSGIDPWPAGGAAWLTAGQAEHGRGVERVRAADHAIEQARALAARAAQARDLVETTFARERGRVRAAAAERARADALDVGRARKMLPRP